MTRTAKSRRYTVRTADGWKIVLYRYAPAGGARPGQAPVFLVHGLGANRYNFDAPGKLSFARHLAENGFDCWVIELRGAGRSSKPLPFNRHSFSWTFGDYYRHDVPAALNLIRDETGHEEVHWIGHSMGGMVAYAWLMTTENPRLRSLTAIGSPCFHHVANPLFDKIIGLRGLLNYVPSIPYAAASSLLVPVLPLFLETAGRLLANPRNLSLLDMVRLISLAPENLPNTLIAQFAQWYAEDGFRDPYGNMHYARELHRIDTPTLLVAGKIDVLATPKDMQYVFDALGSEDKRLEIFGRERGCRHDYGHIDLVLGKYATEEVWPTMLDWLQTH
ncbi:MAG: pimeloyl-ACP methyl ester carboxylesterase [Myxococcota bacterium]|jgi:pimeloyl-ACP methyl ester carboxylesterase